MRSLQMAMRNASMIDNADDDAGKLLLQAARLKAEALGHITEDEQLISEVVRSKVPDTKKAAGNELAQRGDGSSFLFNTLDHPDYLAAEASQRRLQLASSAGALTLAIDTADTVGAENSAEQMLAHQMACAHRASMKLLEQMNALLPHNMAANCESAKGHALGRGGSPDDGRLPRGLLTLQRLRSGGTQKIVVQHVTVKGGGQAIVAGEMEAGGRRKRGFGGRGQNDR